MRQMTEFIKNSFLNSGKRHLVLTGSICSGKTSFADELVENLSGGKGFPGITTHLVSGTKVILRENLTEQETLIGIFENGMHPVEEGFAGLGADALDRARRADSSFALVDEIGFLESENEIFKQAVRNLLEEKSTILVVRKQDLPFLNELRGREDVCVVDVDELHKKVGCVIMASGLGKRFGKNKLLAEFRGKTLIQNILECTEDVFEKRVVVTRTKEVESICENLGIPVIFHELPDRNDAVKLGVEAMDGMDGCIFCPCDQPLLQRHSLKKMRNAFSFEGGEILRLAWEDKVGAPILFDAAYFDELKRLPEKKGGGYLAKKYAEKVSCVFTETEKELYDIDTPDDLKYLEGGGF